MIKKCKICIKKIQIDVLIKENETSSKIWDLIPLKSSIKKWGKEIYFPCDINIHPDNESKDIIKKGEIVFWPEGKVIAIGYGPTPISISNEIRLAGKCNVWGYTESNLDLLDSVSQNDKIEIVKVNEKV